MVGMYWEIDEGVSAERPYSVCTVRRNASLQIMVRQEEWKYIYLANGDREQLFNLEEDPEEIHQKAESNKHVVDRLKALSD